MPDFTKLLEAQVRSVSEAEYCGTLGGTEVRITAKPITPTDMAAMRKKFGDHVEYQPNTEVMCALLIRKAIDPDTGRAAFKQSDKDLLMRIPADDFVAPAFAELFGDQFEQVVDKDGEDHEERVGNS